MTTPTTRSMMTRTTEHTTITAMLWKVSSKYDWESFRTMVLSHVSNEFNISFREGDDVTRPSSKVVYSDLSQPSSSSIHGGRGGGGIWNSGGGHPSQSQ